MNCPSLANDLRECWDGYLLICRLYITYLLNLIVQYKYCSLGMSKLITNNTPSFNNDSCRAWLGLDWMRNPQDATPGNFDQFGLITGSFNHLLENAEGFASLALGVPSIEKQFTFNPNGRGLKDIFCKFIMQVSIKFRRYLCLVKYLKLTNLIAIDGVISVIFGHRLALKYSDDIAIRVVCSDVMRATAVK